MLDNWMSPSHYADGWSLSYSSSSRGESEGRRRCRRSMILSCLLCKRWSSIGPKCICRKPSASTKRAPSLIFVRRVRRLRFAIAIRLETTPPVTVIFFQRWPVVGSSALAVSRHRGPNRHVASALQTLVMVCYAKRKTQNPGGHHLWRIEYSS